MKESYKKGLKIGAIVAGALLLVAVVVGILNAVIANGTWTFGWVDYRYDDENYQIGAGTVPAKGITTIDVDWFDGEVIVVACEDAYISLTEHSEKEVSVGNELHWSVSEDGTTLSVKYRKSAWFFGLGKGMNKQLVLRVPEAFLPQLERVTVHSKLANVSVRDIDADKLEIETDTGNVAVRMETPSRDMEIETKSGSVALYFGRAAAFTVVWETDHGKLTSDYPISQKGNLYTVSTGDAHVGVETDRGDLLLTFYD